MGPSGCFTHVMIYWTVWDRFIQVLYLGRAPRTKETLPVQVFGGYLSMLAHNP